MASLDEENRRLRQLLHQAYDGDELEMRLAYAEGGGPMPPPLRAAASAARRGGGTGDETLDAVIRELKTQVVELTRRNTEVERRAEERASILRRQYEAHIDSLELELRRLKMGGRHVAYTAGAGGGAVSPPAGGGGGYTVAPAGGDGSAHALWGRSAGRTPKSRRNLL